MALSAQTYQGDGSNTDFVLDFTLGYISESHIHVYVNDVEIPQNTLQFILGGGSVRLPTAPASGSEVLVRRIVPNDKLLHDYENGSLVIESNLDESNLQSIMLQHEAVDGFSTGIYGDINFFTEISDSTEDTAESPRGVEQITITGLASLAEEQRDEFESTFNAQFTYKRIGNMSEYSGTALTEDDKLNSYQYPDDSGNWYAPLQGQPFPYIIPSDPTVDNSGMVLTSNVGTYQGLWPDAGGSANKGETWQTQVGGTPTGNYFTALQNTSVDPVGDNVNWRSNNDYGDVVGDGLIVKHRRGTQSEVDAFTGAIAEIVVNTSEEELVLNNGATQGGIPIPKKQTTMLSFDTLDDAVSNTALKLGYSLTLKERVTGKGNGAVWDVVLAASVLPNSDNIIVCTGVPTLALVRRTPNKKVDLSRQSEGYLVNDLDPGNIYPTVERFAQGCAVDSRNSKAYLYVRTSGSTDKNDERIKIAEFNLTRDGSTISPVAVTDELTTGHQGISVQYKPNSNGVYLWTKASPHLPDTPSNEQTGKHVFRWDWKGEVTQNSDAKRYHLFPDNGSGEDLEFFFNVTPCISKDGRYLLAKVSSTNPNTSDQRVFVYDLEVIDSYTDLQIQNPTNFNRDSDAYVTDWPLSRVQLRGNNFTQAISCDGELVFLTCGGPDLNGLQDTVVYTLGGKLLGRFDHFLGDPAEIQNPPGIPTNWEPEGGDILVGEQEEVITLINTAFDDAGTNRVLHQLWGLRKGDSGVVTRVSNAESGADIFFEGSVPREVLFKDGETIRIDVLVDGLTGLTRRAFELNNDGSIRLYQTNEDTTGATGSRVRRGVGSSREILELRGNTGLSDGAAINIYGDSDSVSPNFVNVFTQGDMDNPDLCVDENGRVIFGKRGELKLVNVEGSESNIYKSNSSGRHILEIRGGTAFSNGSGINMYSESDPTNPGNLQLQAGPSGDVVISGLPTSNPGVSGALWNDSGTLRIS